ncbi:DNA-directed DNA polymerase [Klebsiella pneumoniae]|nr:DNA-directed DNA polymerase [Klebsiella pneumoniae]
MALLPVDEVWGVGRRISKNWRLWALKQCFNWLIPISVYPEHFNVGVGKNCAGAARRTMPWA